MLIVLNCSPQHNNSLQELDLDNNKLTDDFTKDENFIQLGKLKKLDLSSNKLTEISPLWCDSMKLEELYLEGNPLSAEGVVVVSKFLQVSLFGGLLLLLLLLWNNSFGLWCLVLVVTAQ